MNQRPSSTKGQTHEIYIPCEARETFGNARKEKDGKGKKKE